MTDMTRKTKKLVYNTVIVCLLLAGLAYVCSRFVHPGVEYTDNAQVCQHITPVNTRVQGFIRKICFDEYQPVSRGDTLLLIEDAEFRLRLAQAEADLANATGNFVKVEQRVPVRIRLTGENGADDLRRLRAGLNVECSVRREAEG